jgi:hypothetical protein
MEQTSSEILTSSCRKSPLLKQNQILLPLRILKSSKSLFRNNQCLSGYNGVDIVEGNITNYGARAFASSPSSSTII